MRTLRPLTVATLLLPLGVVIFGPSGCKQHTPAAPQVGSIAPDFSLNDSTGYVWQLRHLKGDPVLLIFVCRCADCHRLLVALRRIPGTRAHRLVLGSMPPTDLNRLVAEGGERCHGLFDPFGRTAAAYSSLHCPRVWALDSQQIVRYVNKPGQVRPDDVIPAALKAINSNTGRRASASQAGHVGADRGSRTGLRR